MWVLKYYNKAMLKLYETGEGATEDEVRNILQSWIDDEYYARDIESFSETECGENWIIICIDDEIFVIGEKDMSA